MTPPLPWRASTPVDPATYAVAITRLPLARHRRIPTVMRQTVRIVRALSRADGLVGYSLKADLIRKTFWTVSAWTSEAALQVLAIGRARRGDDPCRPAHDRTADRGRARHRWRAALSWTDIRGRLDLASATTVR